MKKLVFVFLILAFTVSFGQNKYMIYFKDKGTLSKETLSKSSDKHRIAKKYLSERSIERRKKNLGENYFTYQDLPVEKNYVANLKKDGIKISNKLKWFNAVTAYLTNEEVNFLKTKEFIDKIEQIRKVKRKNPNIQSLENNNSLNKSSEVYSYDYGSSITQNELSDIPAVHDMGITGEGVRIGILDTGFDWENHVSLSGRTVIAEYDFVYKDNETANDDNDEDFGQHNHGTSVFSIMAGYDSGNLIGPAFNSEFILAKTEYLPKEIHAEEDNYAAALEWMDSIGVDITSSSLGYSSGFENYGEVSYTYADMDGKSTIVTRAAEIAFDRGIVVVTSAGNEGNNIGDTTLSWYYITAPGDGFNTLTIGSVTSLNRMSNFSSRGPTYDGRIKPEIVAMGSSVKNAIAGTSASYGIGSGTSYSAPISAGIAGLLLSAYPHLTNKQIRSIMIESGDNVNNPNNDRGYGLISALRAVTFPNLKQNGNGFSINKLFAPAKKVDENSVEIVFSDGTALPMVKNDNHFEVNLPALTLNENYQIYFKFNDSQGNLQREPVLENYNFNYGKLYVDLVVTDVNTEKNIPDNYYLSQNYPNPFNPTTTIRYSIPTSVKSEKANVKLVVYDVLGRQIKTLVNETKSPGKYEVIFDASSLSSGIYFYQLQAGSFTQTRKLTILK